MDGDQVSCKSVYSTEANKELEDQLNSKRHFISLSGKNIMYTTNEGIDALYALTLSLPTDENKFSMPKF